MSTRRLWIALFVTALMWSQDPASIQVTGAVTKPLTLTAADLAKMPRATVRTKSDGLEGSYEGVWLHDLLKAAGAPSGTDLRGKALASYVTAEAKDGYQAVFSLAELDPIFTENQVLLADSADGKPLVGAPADLCGLGGSGTILGLPL